MKFYLLAIVFINLIIFINSQKTSDDEERSLRHVKVCANCGCVIGKTEEGRIDPYEAFYGIPYAEPPVGDLRFEAPVPYRGWKGYYNATYPRDFCIQKDYYNPPFAISGSEDCLYLQVYRPIFRKKKKLPVMVFLHPGSFIVYASTPPYFGPEYFMDNGEVIVVTFNFRLGLLGFLTSNDSSVKGNFGLKDQQLALQWVATNIKDFGGDPNAVTLLGHNTGAVSAHLHMMNTVSANLFQRVILMGGNAIGLDNYHFNFSLQFRQVAQAAMLPNWDTATTAELSQAFKTVDVLAIVNALDTQFVFTITPLTPVRPCLEGDWPDAFLTVNPRELWAAGIYAHKPMILSTVEEPGDIGALITTNATILAAFNENLYTLLPLQMDFPPRYVTKVLKYYFGKKDTIDETNVASYLRMIGDRFSRYAIILLIKQYLAYADTTVNPIYEFSLNFRSNYTFISVLTRQNINLGVGYTDDIFYLFTQPFWLPPFTPDSPEGKMSDILVRTIVNFIKSGEIKEWRKFEPCTSTSKPFCDKQVFIRNTTIESNPVEVIVNNDIDIDMFRFWAKIDFGVNALNVIPCF